MELKCSEVLVLLWKKTEMLINIVIVAVDEFNV